MRPNAPSDRTRRVNEHGEIDNLFQGSVPPTDTAVARQGEIYPGDGNLHTRTSATIQVYQLGEVRDYNHPDDSGRGFSVLATDVPAVTVWLPRSMGVGWVSQDQGGTQ